MRKNIYALLFLFFFPLFSTAQSIQLVEVDSIFDEYLYVQNNKLLSMKNLVELVSTHQESLALIKKARRKNTYATIIGLSGYLLIGYEVGGVIGDEPISLGVLAIGAGLVGIEFLLFTSANKYTKMAVDKYNSSLGLTSKYRFKPEVRLLAKPNRIGLTIGF